MASRNQFMNNEEYNAYFREYYNKNKDKIRLRNRDRMRETRKKQKETLQESKKVK